MSNLRKEGDNSTYGSVVRVPLPPQVRPGQRLQVRLGGGSDKLVPVCVPMFSDWRMDDKGNRYFNHFISNGTPMPIQPQVNATPKISQRLKTEVKLPQTEEITSFMSYYDFKARPYNSTKRETHQVEISETHELIEPSGRRKALLIGVNYVGTKSRLFGCANDAKTMRHVLLQHNFQDDPEHMIIMIDEFDDDLNSSSPLPTKENIQKGLQWLVQGASKGDVLFFHFSGHGGQVEDKTGFESDGLNETILPLDFKTHGQITDDQIWDTIVYPIPPGVKLIAVMDCCHSGTGLDLAYDYVIKTNTWKEDMNPAHSQGDVVQFSGCRDSQFSMDSVGNFKNGGAMTTAFASALKTNPFATYGDMIKLIHANLKERKFKQRPQLTSSQRFDVNKKVFSFTEGITPNQNSVIGRTLRFPGKKKKKKKFNIFRNC